MTPADLFRSARTAQDSAVFDHDRQAEEISALADEMTEVGHTTMAREFHQFAFVAWRAGQSEHTNPPTPPRWIRCAHCAVYIGDDKIDKGPRE